MIILLYAGVAVFTIAHVYLTLRRNSGPEAMEATKQGAFKGLFALVALVGVGLIIAGWWMSDPAGAALVYIPPEWGIHLNNLLMLFAFLLFGAANGKTLVKRYVRHPQLWSVALWGGAHLLANGELRSVVLFGGLTAWAVVTMLLINQRGPWVAPEGLTVAGTVRNTLISLAIWLAVMLAHVYIFGVLPYPS